MTDTRTVRQAAAWLLGLYLADLRVRAGFARLDPDGAWMKTLAGWGGPRWLLVLAGLLEAAAGAALVLPWVASYGGVALSIAMAGSLGAFAGQGRWQAAGLAALQGLAVGWIACEWWELRVGGARDREASRLAAELAQGDDSVAPAPELRQRHP
jgi:hypothetical protein